MTLFWSHPNNGDLNVRSYVAYYKDVAIVEMNRTGIPASIKLAQAILESNAGTSRLAVEGKNHFGIKCKSYWKGLRILHQDDDYDDEGVLLNSCFRAYGTPLEGYIDHSNFLKESILYEDLIRSDIRDYKIWAKALQQYGYATDSHYGERIIQIIEKYQLGRYDIL